jgi:hypothetical protein
MGTRKKFPYPVEHESQRRRRITIPLDFRNPHQSRPGRLPVAAITARWSA